MGFRAIGLLMGLVSTLSFGVSVGKVEEYRGRVDLLKRDSLKGVPLEKVGTDLNVGDILRTKSDGFAKVFFIDGNRISIFPNSRLKIIEYEEVREVNITRGIVKFEISKGGEGLRIKTPTALIGVKGTVFYVFVTPVFTQVLVLSGSVVFRDIQIQREETLSPKQPQIREVVKNMPQPSLGFSNTPPPETVRPGVPGVSVIITFP